MVTMLYASQRTKEKLKKKKKGNILHKYFMC